MARKRSPRSSPLNDVNRKRRQAAALETLASARLERRGSSSAEFAALVAKKLGITPAESARAAKRTVVHLRAAKRTFLADLQASRWSPQPAFRTLLEGNGFDGDLKPLGYGSDRARLDTVGGPWRYKAVSVNGFGDRLLTSGQTVSAIAGAFLFEYVPKLTGLFTIEIPLIIVGPKFLAADDGLCEDKFAELGVTYNVHVDRQSEFDPNATFVAGNISGWLSSERVTNGTITDTVLWSGRLQCQAQLVSGAKTWIVASVYFRAKAMGAGSAALLLCDRANGGLYVPWADVSGSGVSYP